MLRNTQGTPPVQALKHNFGLYLYIIPTNTVATIWADGSDETYTLVSQDWSGDQWLKTYNNFDPTSSVIFMDQTYCDALALSDCAAATSWNPDAPDDDIFSYEYHANCSGVRSLCMLLAYSSRIGECGSGLRSDRQALASEFAGLMRTTYRGEPAYAIPVDDEHAAFDLRARSGQVMRMPIYGRHTGYLDERLRMIWPVAPNTKYQLRWVREWVRQNGAEADVTVTYGALQADFRLRFIADALEQNIGRL
jgi:hypothetical protein